MDVITVFKILVFMITVLGVHGHHKLISLHCFGTQCDAHKNFCHITPKQNILTGVCVHTCNHPVCNTTQVVPSHGCCCSDNVCVHAVIQHHLQHQHAHTAPAANILPKNSTTHIYPTDSVYCQNCTDVFDKSCQAGPTRCATGEACAFHRYSLGTVETKCQELSECEKRKAEGKSQQSPEPTKCCMDFNCTVETLQRFNTDLQCDTCYDILSNSCQGSRACGTGEVCMIRHVDGRIETNCILDGTCQNHMIESIQHIDKMTLCCNTNTCIKTSIAQINHYFKNSTVHASTTSPVLSGQSTSALLNQSIGSTVYVNLQTTQSNGSQTGPANSGSQTTQSNGSQTGPANSGSQTTQSIGSQTGPTNSGSQTTQLIGSQTGFPNSASQSTQSSGSQAGPANSGSQTTQSTGSQTGFPNSGSQTTQTNGSQTGSPNSGSQTTQSSGSQVGTANSGTQIGTANSGSQTTQSSGSQTVVIYSGFQTTQTSGSQTGTANSGSQTTQSSGSQTQTGTANSGAHLTQASGVLNSGSQTTQSNGSHTGVTNSGSQSGAPLQTGTVNSVSQTTLPSGSQTAQPSGSQTSIPNSGSQSVPPTSGLQTGASGLTGSVSTSSHTVICKDIKDTIECVTLFKPYLCNSIDEKVHIVAVQFCAKTCNLCSEYIALTTFVPATTAKISNDTQSPKPTSSPLVVASTESSTEVPSTSKTQKMTPISQVPTPTTKATTSTETSTITTATTTATTTTSTTTEVTTTSTTTEATTTTPAPTTTEAPTTTTTIATTTPSTKAPTKPIECFKCSGPTFICEQRYHPEQCTSVEHQYCINEMHNNKDGTRTLDRRCATRAECESEWWSGTSDRQECTAYNPNQAYAYVFKCSYCCNTPLCNQNLVPKDLYVGQGPRGRK